MSLAWKIGLAAIVAALLFAALGVLQLRRQNDELDHRAAQIQAQLYEAKAQLKAVKEENDRIKEEFDCELRTNGFYGFQVCGFGCSYPPRSRVHPLP